MNLKMKTMKKLFTLSLLIVFVLFSCEKNETPTIPTTNNDGLVINNDLGSLSSRLIITTPTNYQFKDNLGAKSSTPNIVLEQVAQLLPPKYNDEVLQASHIRIVNGYAFISYNTQGTRYLGGVDIVNITDPNNPVLISGAIFVNSETNKGTDISSLDVEGKGSGNNNFVWLTGASEYFDLETPAFAARYPLNESNQFKHVDDVDRKLVDLKGWVGTDIKFYDGKGSPKVYMTSGTEGGLTILNNGMNESEFFTLDNARSIDVNSDYVVALGGNPGHLFIPNTLNHNIGGATDPEAKSIVRLSNDFALVALGEEGLKCFDLSSSTPGTSISSLPRPIVPNDAVNPWEYVTNSVSVFGEIVYIANGAGGLDVAKLESNGQLTWLGNINLNASVNFVETGNDYIFVATGLGGLTILKIKE